MDVDQEALLDCIVDEVALPTINDLRLEIVDQKVR
jgi:hypothetical protein